MTAATKRYADNCQRDPKWRLRHNLVHNPRANFHYPRASIKSRERSEFRSTIVQRKLSMAMSLADGLKKKDTDAA